MATGGNMSTPVSPSPSLSPLTLASSPSSANSTSSTSSPSSTVAGVGVVGGSSPLPSPLSPPPRVPVFQRKGALKHKRIVEDDSLHFSIRIFEGGEQPFRCRLPMKWDSFSDANLSSPVFWISFRLAEPRLLRLPPAASPHKPLLQ
ncbi:unnamed protein product [Arctogadus glacialis]